MFKDPDFLLLHTKVREIEDEETSLDFQMPDRMVTKFEAAIIKPLLDKQDHMVAMMKKVFSKVNVALTSCSQLALLYNNFNTKMNSLMDASDAELVSSKQRSVDCHHELHDVVFPNETNNNNDEQTTDDPTVDGTVDSDSSNGTKRNRDDHSETSSVTSK